MFEDCVYSTVFCGGAVYHGAIVNVAFSRHLWKEYCVETTPSWNILDICWLQGLLKTGWVSSQQPPNIIALTCLNKTVLAGVIPVGVNLISVNGRCGSSSLSRALLDLINTLGGLQNHRLTLWSEWSTGGGSGPNTFRWYTTMVVACVCFCHPQFPRLDRCCRLRFGQKCRRDVRRNNCPDFLSFSQYLQCRAGIDSPHLIVGAAMPHFIQQCYQTSRGCQMVDGYCQACMFGSLHFTFGRTMDDILTNTQDLALA